MRKATLKEKLNALDVVDNTLEIAAQMAESCVEDLPEGKVRKMGYLIAERIRWLTTNYQPHRTWARPVDSVLKTKKRTRKGRPA